MRQVTMRQLERNANDAQRKVPAEGPEARLAPMSNSREVIYSEVPAASME